MARPPKKTVLIITQLGNIQSMQLRLRKYATSSKDKMKGTKHKEYGMKFL